jgi:septum formation protein
MQLILASTSPTRRRLLEHAGVVFAAEAPRVDEAALREALAGEGARPRDIADALAEAKARKIASRHPEAMVLGCDQVLDLEGEALGKPADRDTLAAQLGRMSGRTHRLHSAAVIYERGEPVWRHVGTVRLTMRRLSPTYISSYLDRNWPGVADCAGGYRIEEEGVRLFERIEGGYFDVLGLPLLEILGYLTRRGVIEG